MNKRVGLGILEASITIGALLGCSGNAALGSVDLDGSYQDIREKIIIDFSRDPAMASRSYQAVFLIEPRKDKKDLVAKIIICGQLKARSIRVNDVCSALNDEGLKDPNDEIRSLAISTLAFSMDDISQSHLVEALTDESDDVRMEAALALGYQWSILSSDPNDPNASRALRVRLMGFCRSKSSVLTSPAIDLCRKI